MGSRHVLVERPHGLWATMMSSHTVLAAFSWSETVYLCSYDHEIGDR